METVNLNGKFSSSSYFHLITADALVELQNWSAQQAKLSFPKFVDFFFNFILRGRLMESKDLRLSFDDTIPYIFSTTQHTGNLLWKKKKKNKEKLQLLKQGKNICLRSFFLRQRLKYRPKECCNRTLMWTRKYLINLLAKTTLLSGCLASVESKHLWHKRIFFNFAHFLLNSDFIHTQKPIPSRS